MAFSIRYFSRLGLSVLNNNLQKQLVYNATRTIYGDESLGLTDFKHIKSIVMDRYKDGVDKFKAKMENAAMSENEMVFTEDLKSVVHLTEKNPEDVELLVKLIKKFNRQDDKLRFGSFKFGPIVMRVLHYVNEPDLAVELFMDDEMGEFFKQASTYLILMDLLYENQRYDQIRQCYDRIIQKLETGHTRLLLTIVALSCYKENTKESLNYGLKMIKEYTSRGLPTNRKAISALGALALNQGAPHIVLELTALCHTFDYISIRCLRNMAFADLDRLDDIVLEFRSALKQRSPDRHSYYTDLVDKVEEAIKRANLGEDAEIVKLLSLIKAEGYIQKFTLDEHLSMPLETINKRQQDPQRRQRRPDGWYSGQSNDYNEKSERPPRRFESFKQF